MEGKRCRGQGSNPHLTGPGRDHRLRMVGADARAWGRPGGYGFCGRRFWGLGRYPLPFGRTVGNELRFVPAAMFATPGAHDLADAKRYPAYQPQPTRRDHQRHMQRMINGRCDEDLLVPTPRAMCAYSILFHSGGTPGSGMQEPVATLGSRISRMALKVHAETVRPIIPRWFCYRSLWRRQPARAGIGCL